MQVLLYDDKDFPKFLLTLPLYMRLVGSIRNLHLPHISIAPPNTKWRHELHFNPMDTICITKESAFTGFSTRCFDRKIIVHLSTFYSKVD